MKNNKIIAMIPARIGSSRLRLKNLALINGTPLIYYAIQAAKKSGVFDKIIINSDHKIFSEIADRYNVDFYLRPKALGSSTTKSDDVVADFMSAHPNADIVVWVNTIAPLQPAEEISDVVNHFIINKLDSLITVDDKQVHCLYKNKPVNYEQNAPFALTQQLKPVQTFVYSIMMWRRTIYLRHYNQMGFALLCGKFGTYPVSKLSSVIIKTDEDLKQAEYIIQSKLNSSFSQRISYDSLTSTIDVPNDKNK